MVLDVTFARVNVANMTTTTIQRLHVLHHVRELRAASDSVPCIVAYIPHIVATMIERPELARPLARLVSIACRLAQPDARDERRRAYHYGRQKRTSATIARIIRGAK